MNFWRLILFVLEILVIINMCIVSSQSYDSYNDALKNNRGKLNVFVVILKLNMLTSRKAQEYRISTVTKLNKTYRNQC